MRSVITHVRPWCEKQNTFPFCEKKLTVLGNSCNRWHCWGFSFCYNSGRQHGSSAPRPSHEKSRCCPLQKIALNLLEEKTSALSELDLSSFVFFRGTSISSPYKTHNKWSNFTKHNKWSNFGLFRNILDSGIFCSANIYLQNDWAL